MDNARCEICKYDKSNNDPLHNGTEKHRFNFKLWEWKHYKKALAKNRHGLELSVTPLPLNGFRTNFTTEAKSGKHTLKITPETLLLHSNNLKFACEIKNTSDNSIIITSADILHPYPLFSMTDPQDTFTSGKYPQLLKGATYKVIVQFQTKDFILGSFKIPVYFTFQTSGKDEAQTFSFARSIIVVIEEDLVLEDYLKNKSPFTNNEWPKNIELVKPLQRGHRPDSYPIPAKYYQCLKYGLKDMGNIDYEVLTEIKQKLQPGSVTAQNYVEFFHVLLWLEEICQTLGLLQYNMENVNLVLKTGRLLELEVPGLAEKRPSVVVGDNIDLRIHDDHRSFRGVIRAVKDKSVEIKFVHDELVDYLEKYPKTEIDVRFVLGRLVLERMHQGIDYAAANRMIPYLFPSESLLKRQASHSIQLSDKDFYNETIKENEEQRTAVVNILNHTSKGAPYIVFGPPGTGKTVTIVEAIFQIKEKTNKRIMVCAPANAACNMLTERLMEHLSKDELLRIMSENVDTDSINPAILSHTNLNEEGEFEKILPQELSKYRVVVTTLILAGRYSRKYHPDVVFIDEAGQALEPEADSAIGLLNNGKQLVLSGDPKQLGPSISSKIAGSYGLDTSLLERLMDLPLYKSNNTNFITMLILNFRSHTKILDLPNRLFYDNKLKPVSMSAHEDPITKLFVYKHIGNKGKKQKKQIPIPMGEPIEFCCVMAKEQREGRSPSYFNLKEAQMVKKYVEALVSLQFDDDEHKVLPSQIGVVTPYIRQVYKVKEYLKQNYSEVEVGTTETFQGREKRIMIITTVRAQEDLLLFDRKYNLGFVRHEKRFNVALTRAMSKLVVIGNPLVLGTDEKWLSYIEDCEAHGTYCGAPYARRTENVISQITRRMGHVSFVDSQYGGNN